MSLLTNVYKLLGFAYILRMADFINNSLPFLFSKSSNDLT